MVEPEPVEPEPVEPEPVEPIEPVETTVVVVKVVVIVVEELESAVGFAVVLDVFVLVSCALVLGGPSLSTPLLSNLQEESTRKKTARIRSCPAPARPPQYPHMKTNERPNVALDVGVGCRYHSM